MKSENEEYPLRWPDGWQRTRIQDRKRQSSWKKSLNDYQSNLEKELKRLGATSYLLTRNRGETLDPGVACYFSRKPVNNYAWQEALGFVGTVPTIEDIDRAYRKLASKYHPDLPTGDIKLFQSLTEHRDRARDWALGRHRAEHEYVLACDVFDEVRLNVNAIRLTIAALRQIERCGASIMLERAFRGFAKSLMAGASSEPAA